jgi:hypothetical protein
MDFGTIQTVSLRDVWAGEATHFTPWLAQNLELLGSKLGMDLELESTEASAGDFTADIIARDLSTNKLVVIENQFGATDHKHLGQVITYSSVLNAGMVVWIAETIRPEHKSAMDFLNQNLKEGLRLYAVEVSVIRIDESKPAFVMNVVSMPTEAPVLTGQTGQQSSETKERYRTFFQELIDELRDRYHFTNARAGQPQNWYTFSSENSRIFKYSTSFAQGGRVRAEVYIDTGDKAKNEEIYSCLEERKEEIERAFGAPLSWEQLETKRACRVAIYLDGAIDDDSEALAQVREWAIQNLLRFKAVFPEHFRRCAQRIVQQLNPADSQSQAVD